MRAVGDAALLLMPVGCVVLEEAEASALAPGLGVFTRR